MSVNENVVGREFYELNEEEMLEVVGGTDANQRATPAIISAVTKLTYAFCISMVSGVVSYRHC